jgi:hypothetical protein
MGESSRFWSTTGTGDGTGSGYTADNMFEVWRALFAGRNSTNLAGVVPDYQNKLAVSGTSSPVAVATGAAVVYGIPYFNTASVNVTVPTPATATRIDRIVLRASWSAQTVRITRVAGVEGGGAPSLTQSAGVTWDMPLATVQVTTGGVVTIADEREYVALVPDGGIATAKLADLAVTTAKIADGAVTSAKIADGTIAAADLASDAVTTAKIADAQVTTAKIADANVTAPKLATDAVTTAKIADAQVTSAKLANMAQATVKGRAAAAGTGVPGDLSAAQLVAVVATADGASSGLDADLLDGSHAAAFAAAAHTHSTSEIADTSVTNAKLATMNAATIKGRAADAGSGAPTDLSAAQLVAIVTAADGHGTGLDADTLDGQQATAFAAAAHAHGTSEISDGAVTSAKMANMAQATVKGRAAAAGTGAPTDLSASQLATIVNSVGIFHAVPGSWTSLTLGAGVSASSLYGTPKYRLNGDVVEFKGGVTSASSGTVTVCDLPSPAYPISGESHTFCHVNTNQVAAMMQAYNDTVNRRIIIYDFASNADYCLSAIRYSITP